MWPNSDDCPDAVPRGRSNPQRLRRSTNRYFSRSGRPKSRPDCALDPSPRQRQPRFDRISSRNGHAALKTRYSSKARAFRLPYSDGCRYDSNRNRCSIHSTQRREQRHWFRAVEADRPKLNERIEPVEFCSTSEDGNVTEQPRQERASPSRARRVERIGEFFAIAVANHYRFRYDSGRLSHQYQRLKGQPHQIRIHRAIPCRTDGASMKAAASIVPSPREGRPIH
ncbi:hypothetical protein SAMN05446935_7573 [Burkholderia sp. YR290]|nr:hypothetical protein SAMN05446935_7573 [Burkholderia sp. YR290]